MKYSDQKQSMRSHQTANHSTSQHQQSHYESVATDSSEPQRVMTADNSVVDAFEYEPNGYMSKGRW